MQPSSRLAASLLGSLALWYPTLVRVWSGEDTLVSGVVRYAMALGLVWFGLALVLAVIDGYLGASTAEAEVEQQEDEAPAEPETHDLSDTVVDEQEQIEGSDEPAAEAA